MPDMASRDTERSPVDELSSKMLQGWTLLAEQCPRSGCETPLVREKGTESMYCVRCHMYCMTEAAGMQGGQVANGMTDTVAVASESEESLEEERRKRKSPKLDDQSDVHSITDDLIHPETEHKESDSYIDQLRQSEEASAKLGELMLQGWTLMDVSCDRCPMPLMKSKQGVLKCVQCGTETSASGHSNNSQATSRPKETITKCSESKTNIPSTRDSQRMSISSSTVSGQSESPLAIDTLRQRLAFFHQRLSTCSDPTEARDLAGTIEAIASASTAVEGCPL
eukprot:95131_1